MVIEKVSGTKQIDFQRSYFSKNDAHCIKIFNHDL